MPDEVETLVKDLGQPKFRAGQIFGWLQSGVVDFNEMTNVPQALRAKLAEIGYIANADVEAKFESKLDETVKFLFRMNDGLFVESVLMKYKHGYSICISTQVGCRMGCTFCASTVNGLDRSLTASEMLAQIMSAQKSCGVRISNIVLMGMGEPFDNYDNVLRFLNLVSHPDGLNIGMRHISLSTCGRVDGIEKLMQEKLQLTLSVSLHAPNDEIRSRTMPINKKSVSKKAQTCKTLSSLSPLNNNVINVNKNDCHHNKNLTMYKEVFGSDYKKNKNVESSKHKKHSSINSKDSNNESSGVLGIDEVEDLIHYFNMSDIHKEDNRLFNSASKEQYEKNGRASVYIKYFGLMLNNNNISNDINKIHNNGAATKQHHQSKNAFISLLKMRKCD